MTHRTVVARATFPLLVVLGLGVAACSDDGGGDREAFCATAQRFAADNPAAAFARADPNDPAASASLLRDAADRLGQWADEAPGEVRDDVHALVDAATSLAEQFESEPSGPGSSAVTTSTTAVGAGVDTAAVEAASTHVVQYVLDECGVNLDV
jgi:hypothetical protein